MKKFSLIVGLLIGSSSVAAYAQSDVIMRRPIPGFPGSGSEQNETPESPPIPDPNPNPDPDPDTDPELDPIDNEKIAFIALADCRNGVVAVDCLGINHNFVQTGDVQPQLQSDTCRLQAPDAHYESVKKMLVDFGEAQGFPFPPVVAPGDIASLEGTSCAPPVRSDTAYGKSCVYPSGEFKCMAVDYEEQDYQLLSVSEPRPTESFLCLDRSTGGVGSQAVTQSGLVSTSGDSSELPACGPEDGEPRPSIFMASFSCDTRNYMENGTRVYETYVSTSCYASGYDKDDMAGTVSVPRRIISSTEDCQANRNTPEETALIEERFAPFIDPVNIPGNEICEAALNVRGPKKVDVSRETFAYYIIKDFDNEHYDENNEIFMGAYIMGVEFPFRCNTLKGDLFQIGHAIPNVIDGQGIILDANFHDLSFDCRDEARLAIQKHPINNIMCSAADTQAFYDYIAATNRDFSILDNCVSSLRVDYESQTVFAEISLLYAYENYHPYSFVAPPIIGQTKSIRTPHTGPNFPN